jgi:hypothetical protein
MWAEPGTGRFSFVKRYLRLKPRPGNPRIGLPSTISMSRANPALELRKSSTAAVHGGHQRPDRQPAGDFPAVFEPRSSKERHRPRLQCSADQALDVDRNGCRYEERGLYRDSNIRFTPMPRCSVDEAEFAQLPEAERERFRYRHGRRYQ